MNDDNFATIVVAIERGRWIYDTIKKYLTDLLRANITEVVVLDVVVLVMGAEYLPLRSRSPSGCCGGGRRGDTDRRSRPRA